MILDRNNAFGCYCNPDPEHKNPPHYQCPSDGSPIAGNCSAVSNGDGMITKALSAATAVKQSPYKACRLALGVETSCAPQPYL